MTLTPTDWSEVLRRRQGKPSKTPTLDMCCCNVGMGDCTIVWLPNDRLVLVDCGTSSWGVAKVADIKALLPVRANAPLPIDVLVLTHAHKDHYGQCGKVIADLSVRMLYHSAPWDDYSYRPFTHWFSEANVGPKQRLTVNASNAKAFEIAKGGNNCSLRAIASDVEGVFELPEDEENTGSVVVKGKFGNDSFMIEGDATCATEEFLLDKMANELPSTLLRVAHHGSQTSSEPTFINKVNAGFAVISASNNGNKYRLPREPVVDRVQKVTGDDWQQHTICQYEDKDTDPCTKGEPEEAYLVEDGPEVVLPPEWVKTKKQLWVTGFGSKAFTMDGR